MVQSAPQLLSVDEFINPYGDDNIKKSPRVEL